MKITAFNPLIVSPKAAEVIEVLEALGFERAHLKEGIEGDGEQISSTDMKYGEEFRVDVAQVDSFERDLTAIRMNVRDFEEAYEFLTARGFKNAGGDKVTDTGSSKAALMVSPSGFAISLAEHIRK